MQVTVNLNDEQLDRLNSVMQQYNITHEEAILMLIGTQPKESELPRNKAHHSCKTCFYWHSSLSVCQNANLPSIIKDTERSCSFWSAGF